MRLKPGAEAELERLNRQDTPKIAGIVFEYVYRLDSNPDEVMLVVGFESKEAYQANANSPEQAERYEEYRALMAAEPEWNDGEIVYAHPE
ncbi:MAG: hypothetical protein QOF01_1688 [Thermomicrobiales bacterium]|jgi:heme-degrading monooxygenase HmoA|nr:hypothetical protein [Thermomicrobiales bacterium]MEA2522820.1 hypothetical protein [Thermomicrobiales bacterium]MEA2595219.1 hypothetical protein [Thermomicrobiales bacterium]